MATTAHSTAGVLRADAEPWHTVPGLQVARELHVEPATGLSTEEAASRLAEIGLNALPPAPEERRWQLVLRQYAGVAPLVLVAAALGSLLVDELGAALALLALTVADAVVGLRRDEHAPAAAGALAAALDVTARVRRDGRMRVLPADRLVPGDVVCLEAGDVVPADGRLLESTALETDESALTGRSLPAPKSVETVEDPATPLGERADMAYMGTRVVRGTAELVVTVTGAGTEIGAVWELLERTRPPAPPPDPDQAQLRRLVPLAAAALAAVAVVGAARGAAGDDVAKAAIAFAVAVLPLSLPVVRIALLNGARGALGRAGIEVRHLRALEALGRVSAIVATEPGTLTYGAPAAVELTLPERRHIASDGSIHRVGGQGEAPLDPVLLAVTLVAADDAGDGTAAASADAALLALAEHGGLDVAATRAAHPRVAELPLDLRTGISATFHRLAGAPGATCFAKGPPDQLLARSSHRLAPDGAAVPVDAAFRERYAAERDRMVAAGLFVLTIARRDIAPRDLDPRSDLPALLDRLTLLALVGIADPPRPGVREAIAKARAAGIGVWIVSGRDEPQAAAAARALGIAEPVLPGAQLAAMAEAEAAVAVGGGAVVSRASALQGLRLVQALEHGGHAVAMTGVAIADGPALQAAHAGIATAPPPVVLADAAALVAPRDGLAAVVHVIEAGRRLTCGLGRVRRFQASLGAGIALTFVGAAAFGIVAGLVLLPLQALYLAFSAHLPLSLALASGAAEDDDMARPVRPVDRRPTARVAVTGAAEAVAALAVLAIADSAHDARTARTMGLATLALVAVLLAFTFRDDTRPALSAALEAPRPLLVAAGIAFAAALAAAQTDLLQRMLQTNALDFDEWLLCGGAALAVVAAAEAGRQIIRIR